MADFALVAALLLSLPVIIGWLYSTDYKPPMYLM